MSSFKKSKGVFSTHFGTKLCIISVFGLLSVILSSDLTRKRCSDIPEPDIRSLINVVGDKATTQLLTWPLSAR